jgi:hypothetical protein
MTDSPSPLQTIVDAFTTNNLKVALVVGPQRAGTQIGSKILAKELGARFFHAQDFGIGDLNRFFALIDNSLAYNGRTVIHSAAVMQSVELAPPDVAVVCMRREVKAVLASQTRIKWTHLDAEEKQKFNSHLYASCYDENLTSTEVKYLAWVTLMKPRITYAYDLPYESLSAHPMFLSKSQRQHFQRAHQTE